MPYEYERHHPPIGSRTGRISPRASALPRRGESLASCPRDHKFRRESRDSRGRKSAALCRCGSGWNEIHPPPRSRPGSRGRGRGPPRRLGAVVIAGTLLLDNSAWVRLSAASDARAFCSLRRSTSAPDCSSFATRASSACTNVTASGALPESMSNRAMFSTESPRYGGWGTPQLETLIDGWWVPAESAALLIPTP